MLTDLCFSVVGLSQKEKAAMERKLHEKLKQICCNEVPSLRSKNKKLGDIKKKVGALENAIERLEQKLQSAAADDDKIRRIEETITDKETEKDELERELEVAKDDLNEEYTEK